MQILIVEDNKVSATLMTYLFEKLGNCELASDGAEAVELFEFCIEEDNTFDLICLDIHMPNLDGLEALKKIRNLEEQNGIDEENRAKVIIATADPNPPADEYKDLYQARLMKPISKQSILSVLEELGIEHPDNP